MDSNSPKDEKPLFPEALQRQWLLWMGHKWNQINHEIMDGRLRAPIFRIGWASGRLGAWASSGRVLEIQADHLANATAAEVEYTLRHEMAHQIVHELFLSPGAKPHGPLFRKACGLLGILGGPQDAVAESAESERILRKARKLLSLASSSSTHEAASAMARAQEILNRYNLNLEDSGVPPNYGFLWLGQPQGRVPLERKLVAEIIQEFFFVRCVWIRTYTMTKRKNTTLLETFGRHHNLALASYVHDCLMRHLNDLWSNHKTENPKAGAGDRSAFRVGVIMGFREYLSSLVAPRSSDSMVWKSDPALQEFISSRHPRLVRAGGGRYRPGRALEAGRKEGKRLRIQPGVTSSNSRPGRQALLAGD